MAYPYVTSVGGGCGPCGRPAAVAAYIQPSVSIAQQAAIVQPQTTITAPTYIPSTQSGAVPVSPPIMVAATGVAQNTNVFSPNGGNCGSTPIVNSTCNKVTAASRVNSAVVATSCLPSGTNKTPCVTPISGNIYPSLAPTAFGGIVTPDNKNTYNNDVNNAISGTFKPQITVTSNSPVFFGSSSAIFGSTPTIFDNHYMKIGFVILWTGNISFSAQSGISTGLTSASQLSVSVQVPDETPVTVSGVATGVARSSSAFASNTLLDVRTIPVVFDTAVETSSGKPPAVTFVMDFPAGTILNQADTVELSYCLMYTQMGNLRTINMR